MESMRICGKEYDTRRQKDMLEIAVFQLWENTWKNHEPKQHLRHCAPADPEILKTANITTDQKTDRIRMNLKGTPSAIHQNLKRAQSSIAIQIRSEHIGLNAYMHRRNVTEVEDSRCQCGYPSQNAKHMVMVCPQWAQGRGEVLQKAKHRSFEAMMDSPEDVARITQWIQREGWIEQFRLTRVVEAVMEEMGTGER